MLQFTVSAPEEVGGEHKVVLVATSTSGGGQKGGAQPGVLVRFYRQGREIGQEMTEGDGRAVLEVPGLTPGTHLFEAQVDGPPLVKSSRSVTIPKPASKPAKIVKDIEVYAVRNDGDKYTEYTLTISCKDAEGNPVAAQGRVFGLNGTHKATSFTLNSSGTDDGQLRVRVKSGEKPRELLVQIGSLRERLTLLGPLEARINTTNNWVCLVGWLAATLWLVVNVVSLFAAVFGGVSATEAEERFLHSVLEEGGGFSFAIPLTWKLLAGWVVGCLIYTPIAFRDEAVWAFQVAKRGLIEDRGGRETAPTPKTTSSSSTTTATPADAGGGKPHLTWRSYVKWEFVISLATIFLERIVAGAFERRK